MDTPPEVFDTLVQSMSNSPGAVQSAGTIRMLDYGLCLQYRGDPQPARIEVHIERNGEIKQMTYAEFFTRLGFKE